jgi:hypothetical protein
MTSLVRDIVRFPVGYTAVGAMFCVLLLVVWNSVGMLREASRFQASFEGTIAEGRDPRPFLSAPDCGGHLSAAACRADVARVSASLDVAWASAPAIDRGACLRSHQRSPQRDLLSCLLTKSVRGDASGDAS